MLRTAFWGTWLVLYIISRQPMYWRAMYLKKKGRIDEMQAIVDKQVDLWSHRVMKHIRMDLTVEGQENMPPKGEAAVYVCNHQSFLDIIMCLADLGPFGFMAKDSLGKIPLLGGWIRLLGCVLVEREDMRAAAAAIREAQEVLESGRSLIIFPEGTRSKGPDIIGFKAGAVRIALKAGAPIIPVALEGGYKALEGNGYKVQPTKAYMKILPRVDTSALSREEQKALAGALEAQIRTAKASLPALPE